MKKFYLFLLVVLPIITFGQNQENPYSKITVKNPFSNKVRPDNQAQSEDDMGEPFEMPEYRDVNGNVIESSEKKSTKTSTKKEKENPFLKTLGSWNTINTNDKETIERFRQQEEWRKDRQMADDIKDALYVIFPILLVIMAIAFLYKVLKTEKDEND